MSRIRRNHDIEEVSEIIELRLKEVNGILSKLSYNGVYQLNKKISNNPDYLRKNKTLFKSYAYDFWGGKYKGEDNFGKQQIDKIKAERELELVSGIFDQSLQDVLLAVNDLHNNPVKLSKVLVNIYEDDKAKIDILENENQKLKEKNKELKSTLETIQSAIYTIFYNSNSARNSLINMLDIKRSQDDFMSQQISKAFCTQLDLLERLKDNAAIEENEQVTNINLEKRIKKISELGI